jgi:hypothetical protein
MSQRNITEQEVNIIYRYGTEIRGNGIYFTKKNAEELLKDISTDPKTANLLKQPEEYLGTKDQQDKYFRQKINKLVGWKIVVENRTVITCYLCDQKNQQKKISRNIR